MSKRILKIIGALSIALVVSLGSFFVPKLRTSEAQSASAFSSSTGSSLGFNYTYFDTGSFYAVAFSSTSNITNKNLSNFNLNSSNSAISVDLKYVNTNFSFYVRDGGSSGIAFSQYGASIKFLLEGSSSSLTRPLSSNSGDRDGFYYVSLARYSDLYNFYNSDVSDKNFVNGNYSDNYSYYHNSTANGYYYVYFELSKNYNSQSEFSAPSGEFVKLTTTSSPFFEDLFGYAPTFNNANIFAFTDSNGFNFIVYTPISRPYSAVNWYYQRTNISLLQSLSLTDNQFYLQGLSDGYSDGYNVGKQSGFLEGYNSGYNIGKNDGYEEGLIASNQLTFSALMTSVIDVPVKVFVSLFDFDILGVNILVFLSTLLTICLVLFLIKKIKGA